MRVLVIHDKSGNITGIVTSPPDAPPIAEVEPPSDGDVVTEVDRATRREREPPSDAEIERGLRERAVSDPRAAEILLRWLQRPRAEERVGGADLDSLSERQLERLYAGLLRIAALPEEDLRALIASLLAETEAN